MTAVVYATVGSNSCLVQSDTFQAPKDMVKMLSPRPSTDFVNGFDTLDWVAREDGRWVTRASTQEELRSFRESAYKEEVDPLRYDWMNAQMAGETEKEKELAQTILQKVAEIRARFVYPTDEGYVAPKINIYPEE